MFKSEAKVGLVVLIALLGLAWLTYKSGSISGFEEEKSRILLTETKNAAGLFAGSKVKIAGVNIGFVKEINLTPNGEALIHLSVKKDVPLAANVFARIDSDGLIGAKFVSLNSPAYTKDLITDEVKQIPFRGNTNIEDIGQKFSSIASDLGAVADSLRESLATQQSRQKLQNIITNLDLTTSRLSGILNNEIKPGQVGRIADNIDHFSTDLSDNSGEILENVKEASASLNRILNANEDNIDEIITEFTVVSDNLSEITTSLANDKSTLGQLINNDSQIVSNLDDASANLAEITDRIASGQGTLGKLINDDSTINKINGALDSLGGIASRISQIRTEVDLYGYPLIGNGVVKGRFDLTIATRPNRFYLLGITSDGYAVRAKDNDNPNNRYYGQDFGDKLKFSAQFGRVYENVIFNQDVALRFGVRDSTFGVGFDTFALDDRMRFSADFYDFGGDNNGNNQETPHIDLTAKYLFKGIPFYGMFGVDNVINKDLVAPFVGAGIRFGDDDFKYLLSTAGGAAL